MARPLTWQWVCEGDIVDGWTVVGATRENAPEGKIWVQFLGADEDMHVTERELDAPYVPHRRGAFGQVVDVVLDRFGEVDVIESGRPE